MTTTKLQTEGVINQVISLFSLQPIESPAHNVEVYGQGFRVPVTILALPLQENTTETLYIYALPWSRGWSVFVTDANQGRVGSHSWRDVPSRFKGLQRPVHNPRYRLGPWNTSPSVVADAVLDLVTYLERLDRARRKRYAKRHWYWSAPTSTIEVEPSQEQEVEQTPASS